MKHLILVAALALLPAVALAQDASAPAPDAAAPMPEAAAAAPDAAAVPSNLPKCSAKVTDSCQQTKAQQANALDHYPADTRDAGNNKIGGAGMSKPAMHMKHRHAAHKATTTMTTTTTETPAK